MCKSLAKSYRVILLARWGGELSQKEEVDGFTVIRAGFKMSSKFSIPISSNPLWKKEIEQAILDYEVDLVIVREIMLGTAAGKMAKKHNLPIIMDMAENYPAAMKLWKKYNANLVSRSIVHNLKIPDRVEKKSINLMDGIIFVCKENKYRIDKLIRKNYKSEIIYNTPTLDIEKKPDYDPSLPYKFIHHGYLTNEKSLILFFENIEKNIIKTNSDYLFRLYGTGENEADYQKYEHTLDIQLMGKYEFSDLPNILKGNTFGLLCYEANDFNNNTLHNKVFDYFKFGIPVLTSNMKPTQNLIEDTNSGFVIDFGNKEKLERSLEFVSEDELQEKSNNAFDAYKTIYNWAIDESKLLNFINKFI